MDTTAVTSQNVHLYRPKAWTLALNIFLFFFFCMVLGMPVLILAWMLRSMIQTQSGSSPLSIVFLCLFSPILILSGIVFVQMILNVILSFFSFIKISPSGIEQKHVFTKHIQSDWSQVDKIEKYFLWRDVLYLNSFQVVGPSLSLRSPFRFLRPRQRFISLTGYQGWPDGQLAGDLKQYAPQLFEKQTVLEEIPRENKTNQILEAPISEISQESRLFAALSHASIMFSTAGMIVPIAIYALQRKKSSYVGFQAMQAFVWQIAAFVFSLFSSVCMVSAVFVPIFFAAAFNRQADVKGYSVGMLVMMMASLFLMVFGNLAFVIYGIVGAIKTYRGRDFRYVIIGDRIRKNQGLPPTESA